MNAPATAARAFITNRSDALLVHGIRQAFAGGEARPPGRLDLPRGPGPRTAAFTSRPLPPPKITDPNDLDFATLLQRPRDRIEGRVNRRCCRRLGHLRLVGHCRDELVLGHLTDPF